MNEKNMNEEKAIDEFDENCGEVLDKEAEEKPERHKAHMLDPASSMISIELPCGHIKDGVIYKNAVFKEMTGVEEDIIASKGELTTRLNLIIFNCLVSLCNITDRSELRQAVNNMTGPDRLISLIAIRRVSHGDFFDTKEVCPNRECKLEGGHSINLVDVEVTPMKDPLVREFEHVLSTGKKVCWHVLNIEDETWLQSIRKKNKESIITLGLMARVDRINGDKIDREGRKGFKQALGKLKNLPAKERREIRNLFKEHEGNVDTETTFECLDCGTEWKKDMPIGDASFFFPSA